LMANLQANLRSQCATAVHEPSLFLQSVNRIFCQNSPEASFATLFFAEYDDRSHRMRYANCGHLPALLVRADGACERLDSTATVLGVFPEWECGMGECELAAGDTFALYTDGITESFNEDAEEYGEWRLVDALRRSRETGPQAMLATVIEEVRRFGGSEQRDDITLVIARCRC
jgi:phosphoserine phosphatase RsbU/P